MTKLCWRKCLRVPHHSVTMLLIFVIGLLAVSGCSTTFLQLDQVIHPFLNLLGVHVRPARCGPCPSRDCRRLPAIVLGYCCGCALPIDRVPIVCPPTFVCPPAGPRLCRDYNYLMECCC